MASLKVLATYHGPSIHADEPAVEVALGLSDDQLAGVPAAAARIVAATSRYFSPATLPDAHPLSVGRFIVELARALANERGGVIRAAAARLEHDGIVLTLGFHHPQGALMALEAAVRLSLGAGKASAAEIDALIARLMDALAPVSPDPQALILLTHALAANIPARRIDERDRLWQFGWGARSEIHFEASSRADSVIAHQITVGKDLMKRLAQAAGFRVQAGMVVGGAADLEQAARAIGFPCVTKPVAGSHSRGVTVGIVDLPGLHQGWVTAQAVGKGAVFVERYAEGDPHRVMVMHGKVWKAILRPRPFVIADGVASVEALARARNDAVLSGRRPSSLWRPAPLDAAFVACLRRQGLAPDSVPAAGRKVLIREIPMMDQGAAAYEDVTPSLHPQVRAAAEELARMLRAGCLGLDLMAEDLSRPEGVVFLEANLMPELRVLKAAGLSDGEIGRALLGDGVGRLPATLIVAPRAAHDAILARQPRGAGLGWTDGRSVGVGEDRLPPKVPSPHDGADLLVRRPSVQSILVLADPADITERGLPLDRFDRAVLAEEAGLGSAWVDTIRRRSGEVSVAKVSAI